jgi:dCTP deaminase
MPEASSAQLNGVLPSQWIRSAFAKGWIEASAEQTAEQIQPNSLDLRLDGVGWRVQCSFLPGDEGMTNKLHRFGWYPFDIPDDGIVLERNQVYLFPLCERLNLPPEVYGRANPKSSTGRLDVFTRVVTEYGTSFDRVPASYRGALYLEVVPRSFAIRVRKGDSLAQIRFQVGDPRLSVEETVRLLDTETILLGPDLDLLRSSDVFVPSGMTLSVHLPQRNDTIGYQARKNTAPIDLRARGMARRNHWDRLYGDGKPIILEPDDFYIFRSSELVRLPPDYCAEMVAFDASSGEVRTHYAGFFDSGFGFVNGKPASETAAAVVLEVRSRDVPFFIEDRQPLFRVHLLRCTEPPDLLYGSLPGSNYQTQRLRLSKQFNAVPEVEETDRSQPRLDFSGEG